MNIDPRRGSEIARAGVRYPVAGVRVRGGERGRGAPGFY